MILFKTRVVPATAENCRNFSKTQIAGWRTVLRFELVPDSGKAFCWFSWEPEVKYADREWCVYNSPGSFSIGFMQPFLVPEFSVFAWDGVALCSIVLGWFRINWSRWATHNDYDT